MPTDIFARSILHSHEFLARCALQLGALKETPALIVRGDVALAFRAKERERFEGALPQHTTEIVHAAGHDIWDDAPEQIAAALRAWWV